MSDDTLAPYIKCTYFVPETLEREKGSLDSTLESRGEQTEQLD